MARALCLRSASTALYIADLDALQGAAPQVECLRRLLDGLPGLTLWIDAGFADAQAALALQRQLGADHVRLLPVFASESLASVAALRSVAELGQRADEEGLAGVALSLDRRDGRHLDPAGCWDAPALWPQRIIVMTLERVGTDAGPDLETIAGVRRQAPAATLIGAGGLRDAADLVAAGEAGADAWLVASALHALRL
jgi:phosphoribosylformimino-5-aminoimidazole carboxamide ribotide isomerase